MGLTEYFKIKERGSTWCTVRGGCVVRWRGLRRSLEGVASFAPSNCAFLNSFCPFSSMRRRGLRPQRPPPAERRPGISCRHGHLHDALLHSRSERAPLGGVRRPVRFLWRPGKSRLPHARWSAKLNPRSTHHMKRDAGSRRAPHRRDFRLPRPPAERTPATFSSRPRTRSASSPSADSSLPSLPRHHASRAFSWVPSPTFPSRWRLAW